MSEDDREKWHDAYIEELKELYFIVLNIIEQNYDLPYLDDSVAFHNFSRLAFNDSSKFISEYTKSSITKDT